MSHFFFLYWKCILLKTWEVNFSNWNKIKNDNYTGAEAKNANAEQVTEMNKWGSVWDIKEQLGLWLSR